MNTFIFFGVLASVAMAYGASLPAPDVQHQLQAASVPEQAVGELEPQESRGWGHSGGGWGHHGGGGWGHHGGGGWGHHGGGGWGHHGGGGWGHHGGGGWGHGGGWHHG
ncbi:major prion protein 1-like [Plodia interpunctella]|uniref:major prion protein 1-like n=1 Tax=Plodia interpunctella TaxID=58824 RepID=UPI002368EE72|nr:major prion protein 1-like [Plodia interpunctella]